MAHILRTKIAQKFVQLMMMDGKKTKAEHILLKALDHIRVVKRENPVTVMYAAVAKVSPPVEVRTVRARGSSYQVRWCACLRCCTQCNQYVLHELLQHLHQLYSGSCIHSITDSSATDDREESSARAEAADPGVAAGPKQHAHRLRE